MDSPVFHIKHHVILGQHIREYPRATAATDIEDLSIDIKQYTPIDNPHPQRGDPTIVLAGGIGFIKELYEPLFEQIYTECRSLGVKVRGFWVADPAAQGLSAIENADKLGNEPHWFDHSRDLLHMVNVFRDEMPRPLVGMGHSFGGSQIAYLAMIHPRLFTSLILIEPAIHLGVDIPTGLAQSRNMMKRRERWPSREAAETWVRKSKYYQRWDARTVDRLLKYGFRPVEPTLDWSAKDAEVQTTTLKDHELSHMYRANSDGIGTEGLAVVTPKERLETPDADPEAIWLAPLYRNEARIVFKGLPNIRPSVQYIVGDRSGNGAPAIRNARLESTGIGVGGSGGAKWDRVRQHVVRGGEHTIPLDMHIEETSKVAAGWITEEMKWWSDAEALLKEQWDKLEASKKQEVPKETLQIMKDWNGEPYDPARWKTEKYNKSCVKPPSMPSASPAPPPPPAPVARESKL